MSSRLNLRSGVFLALLGSAASPVFAQSAPDEKGFYTGAVAGVAAYPASPIVSLGPYTLHSIDTREDDMSWGFTGGYRFGRYFALEAGYVDLGEGTARLIESSGAPVQADLHFSARGATLAAVVLFPMRKWEPFVKAGMLFQDAELRIDGTEAGAPFSLSASASSGTKALFETGVSYRFNEKWKATLGFAFFVDVGDERRTGEADIKSHYLGITYQF
jgi:OmpA-OmpF porin, OOP family